MNVRFEDAFDEFIAEVCARRGMGTPPPGARLIMKEAFFSGTAFMIGAMLYMEDMSEPMRKGFVQGLRQQQQEMREALKQPPA